MSLIKNTGNQFLYGVLVNKNDGAPVTTGATLELAKDGAAPSAADAVLTHRTEGLWEAALSQADTNGEIIGYVWGGANVVTQGGTVVTVEYERDAISDIQASIDWLITWAEAGGGSGGVPSPDDPCAQNPAKTRGPTTEPALEPLNFTRQIRLPTNNH